MFKYVVHVMLIYKYSTLLVNTNPIHLLNKSRILNPNMTCLLNELVMLTHLLDFYQNEKKNTNFSFNPINLNYKR